MNIVTARLCTDAYFCVCYESGGRFTDATSTMTYHSSPQTYFQTVEPNCNAMLCPPYDDEKELTCAVCTR